MALDCMPMVPPTLKALTAMFEIADEPLICLLKTGKFGALESASKLLEIAEPWNTALPPMLVTKALVPVYGSLAAHSW